MTLQILCPSAPSLSVPVQYFRVVVFEDMAELCSRKSTYDNMGVLVQLVDKKRIYDPVKICDGS